MPHNFGRRSFDLALGGRLAKEHSPTLGQHNVLLFDDDERGPSDDLKLQFEAASRLDDHERRVVKELIEGMLLKHEAKRWTASA